MTESVSLIRNHSPSTLADDAATVLQLTTPAKFSGELLYTQLRSFGVFRLFFMPGLKSETRRRDDTL